MRAPHISLHPIFMRSWCGCSDSLRLSLPLLAVPLLSYRPVHPPGLHLFLPWCGETSTLRTLANEDLGALAEYDLLTGYEPNDLHISETTELYTQESSGENRSLNSHDLECDDYTIGIALSSPLFTQEREDAASRRRAYHSPSQSSSVGHRTGRPVGDQFDSLISNVRENPRRSSENERIRILLERQREQILADCQAEIQKHEFQADYDRIQKLNEVIESQRGEIYRGSSRRRTTSTRSTTFFMNNYWNKIGIFVKLMRKSLNEMEELKRFQGSTFDTISRRKLIEDRDTILELTGKIQELQNEIHGINLFERFSRCWISTQWTTPRSQSHLIQFLVECSAVLQECRAAKMGRQVFGTHMVYRENVFANPTASSSAPCPQESNPWISNVFKHTTLGLCIPGYGAAEVFIDLTGELRHTETDPMCKIHKGRCTSRWHSRPTSLARNDLRRWTSSAQPPMLQNLRVGLRRRQSGKSDVPVKQRGSWPKVCWIQRSKKEQHSSRREDCFSTEPNHP